jgi:hypothetical protein
MTRRPYEYPTLKTGTSQDLLTVVTKAYERHLAATGAELPRKTRAARLALEFPFVLVGKAVAAAMRLMPAETSLSLHDKLFSGLSAPRSYPFEPGSPALARARAEARRLETLTGKKPALLALISHPPVMGEAATMNFELVRHASLALRVVRGAPCRPRLVAAIDPFALDTTPLYQEGVYAGFMGTYHLGLDRMSLGRPAASRLFLPGTGWDRMAHRLLRLLQRGGEAGMVLAGGVPSTTRTLYAAREWVAEARRQSPLKARPAEILARLRVLPGFARLEAEGPHGRGLGKSVWRLAELYAMAFLSGVFVESVEEGKSCADLGTLDQRGRTAMLAFLAALGLSDELAAESLARLSEELGRETPFRRRFFRILAGRIARRRPVVLLPIVHRFGENPGVEVREAWGISGFEKGMMSAMMAGPVPTEWRMRPQDLAVQFVRENFS